MCVPGDTLPIHVGSINERTGLTVMDVQTGEKTAHTRVDTHEVIKLSDLRAYLSRHPYITGNDLRDLQEVRNGNH
jgi:hypothetical protein